MNTSFLSTCISASAGSGKTYQLVLRYIGLLVLGVAPERIIALTFTRKAASEFAQRILQRLARAAQSDEQAESLAKDLRETLEGSPSQPALALGQCVAALDLSQERFRQLLWQLVHVLGKLKLSTLDSFFAKMLGVLSLDLGLPSVRIEEEGSLLTAQNTLLNELYQTGVLDDVTKKAFLKILEDVLKGKETDKVHATLLELTKEYHQYYLQAPHEEKWGNKRAIWGDSLPEWPKGVELAAVPALVDELLATIPIEDKGVKESLRKSLESLRAFSNNQVSLKLLPKSINNADFFDALSKGNAVITWYKKEYPIPQEWGDKFLSLLRGVVRFQIESVLGQTQGLFKHIEQFEKNYQEKVRGAGQLVFPDVARLLRCEWQEGDMPAEEYQDALQWLKFRMDGWFEHWMLDEFQDTSFAQWSVVKDFLEEIMQDETQSRSAFVVGDGKQSIYEWTGASPEVFTQLHEEEPWKTVLKAWAMNVSYRSAPAILDFVNRCCDFSKTAKGIARPEALNRWIFEEHQPALHNKELTGCVQVWSVDDKIYQEKQDVKAVFSSNEKQEEESSASFAAISKLLLEIRPWERRSEKGGPLSCAILVRTNKKALDMKNWLMSASGGNIPVEIESDAYVGMDSPLGLALADFFLWLQHPLDDFAWEHLCCTPLGHSLNRQQPGESWQSWRHLYECGGLSAVLAQWESYLSADGVLVPFAQDRLNIWKDAAYAADKEGISLEEWLVRLPAMKRREHSRSHSVQIMTVHKSKGMEFDIVILPLAEKKIAPYADEARLKILKKMSSTGQLEQLLIPPPALARMMDAVLFAWKEEWAINQELDGFCNLYVALTRAARACYIFVKSPKKDDKISCSSSTLIKSACGESAKYDKTNSSQEDYLCNLIRLGEIDWFEQYVINREAKKAASQKSFSFVLPAFKGEKKVENPSSWAHKDVVSSFFTEEQVAKKESLKWGSKVHALFEQINWLPAPEFQEESAARFCVEACLCVPEIAAIFTCPSSPYRLWKEQAIEGIWKKEKISGVIDRAQLVEGILTVIEYKTDSVDSLELLIERYQWQLICYRDLLCQLLEHPLEKTRCLLISTHLKKVASF